MAASDSRMSQVHSSKLTFRILSFNCHRNKKAIHKRLLPAAKSTSKLSSIFLCIEGKKVEHHRDDITLSICIVHNHQYESCLTAAMSCLAALTEESSESPWYWALFFRMSKINFSFFLLIVKILQHRFSVHVSFDNASSWLWMLSNNEIFCCDSLTTSWKMMKQFYGLWVFRNSWRLVVYDPHKSRTINFTACFLNVVVLRSTNRLCTR